MTTGAGARWSPPSATPGSAATRTAAPAPRSRGAGPTHYQVGRRRPRPRAARARAGDERDDDPEHLQRRDPAGRRRLGPRPVALTPPAVDGRARRRVPADRRDRPLAGRRPASASPSSGTAATCSAATAPPIPGATVGHLPPRAARRRQDDRAHPSRDRPDGHRRPPTRASSGRWPPAQAALDATSPPTSRERRRSAARSRSRPAPGRSTPTGYGYTWLRCNPNGPLLQPDPGRDRRHLHADARPTAATRSSPRSQATRRHHQQARSAPPPPRSAERAGRRCRRVYRGRVAAGPLRRQRRASRSPRSAPSSS